MPEDRGEKKATSQLIFQLINIFFWKAIFIKSEDYLNINTLIIISSKDKMQKLILSVLVQTFITNGIK